MSRIEPTIGRIVHLYHGTEGPYAAIVTDVSLYAERGLIEVHAFHRKHAYGSSDYVVPLLQDDGAALDGWHAQWMPYQLGQAAKTEEVIASAKSALNFGALTPEQREQWKGPVAVPNLGAMLGDGPVRIEPRSKVTRADIDAEMGAAQYDFTVLPNGRTTIASVTLRNGFTLIGQSSCAARENFDAALGQKYAVEDVERQLWDYLGFRLHDERMRPAAYIVEQGTLSDAQLEELAKPGLVVAGPPSMLGG